MEVRLEDRHQHQIHRHLYYPVLDGRDPQRAEPSAGFRDLHPAHRRLAHPPASLFPSASSAGR